MTSYPICYRYEPSNLCTVVSCWCIFPDSSAALARNHLYNRYRFKTQFRFEAFNFLNTPHFGLPNTNVSNMVLNPDGTIKNLGSFSTITSTQNLGRDFDERHIHFYLRFSF